MPVLSSGACVSCMCQLRVSVACVSCVCQLHVQLCSAYVKGPTTGRSAAAADCLSAANAYLPSIVHHVLLHKKVSQTAVCTKVCESHFDPAVCIQNVFSTVGAAADTSYDVDMNVGTDA